MELSSRQLSSLNTMGIPVWEFRSTQSEVIAIVDDIIPQQPSEQLLKSDWVVMIDDKTYGEQAQRLLYAMLFAIGVEKHEFAIIDAKQLVQLDTIPTQNKVLIVLSTQVAKQLLGESIVRGSVHKTLNTQVTTVVSFGLDELLANPENKVQAWQDLQLAKQALLK